MKPLYTKKEARINFKHKNKKYIQYKKQKESEYFLSLIKETYAQVAI